MRQPGLFTRAKLAPTHGTNFFSMVDLWKIDAGGGFKVRKARIMIGSFFVRSGTGLYSFDGPET